MQKEYLKSNSIQFKSNKSGEYAGTKNEGQTEDYEKI